MSESLPGLDAWLEAPYREMDDNAAELDKLNGRYWQYVNVPIPTSDWVSNEMWETHRCMVTYDDGIAVYFESHGWVYELTDFESERLTSLAYEQGLQ